MKTVTHPYIAIGSSAGGWETLPLVLENLPEDFPASIFVVQHLSGESIGAGFLNHLSRTSVLPCAFAVDNEPVKPGRVYLAPPDHHMLKGGGRLRVTKGPRENGFRPSLDTLFRSIAYNFPGQSIGVILSGMGDDGTEGLATIGRTGGITMVQDPQDAPFPDMPQAAIEQMEIDYKVKGVDMGLVLANLVYRETKGYAGLPEDVAQEAAIAERVLTSIDAIEEIGIASPFTCPDCGGVLHDIDHQNGVHSFRCHAGHAFSAKTLFKLKSKEAEEALWASLRLLEEQKRMLRRFPSAITETSSVSRRLAENDRYITLLKDILLSDAESPD
ncbi:chemotaxis protein CheB [Pedobacter sp. SYP-B3415]|uniref:chemotaxis protein CheB n=1 Tax=Pedobacter sp. SYP-B3415 TaxID=2496641 RepID=UPI0013EA73BD|nr:chemotaxis protein CheB [Pedobacter sp. SYP-B3415]